MTVKEFNFEKASSLLPATALKINFVGSIFQRFFLVFKNVFFQKQVSLTAFIFLLKSVSCSLKDVLKIFGIFPGKPPCISVISIK